MDTVSNPTQTHILNDKWDLYYHLPQNNNWSLNGYVPIQKSINTAENVIMINNNINDNIIKNCMLFAMRDGITPMWEDPKNRNGGCFSYKVNNRFVCEVWRQLFKLLCGESLCINKSLYKHINGITTSPKKQFCIVKIWLDTTKIQDPGVIIQINNLIKQGCLFKSHAPEY